MHVVALIATFREKESLRELQWLFLVAVDEETARDEAEDAIQRSAAMVVD